MDGVTLYFTFLAIVFAIFFLVAVVRCARLKSKYEKLRAEVDHAERDENLRAEILKECDKRIVDYTISSLDSHVIDYHDRFASAFSNSYYPAYSRLKKKGNKKNGKKQN